MDYLHAPGTGEPRKTDVVIPALNEADTIGTVIGTFRSSPRIGNIIVVNDLSSDRTANVARNAGAIVVKGPGTGKGQAMMRGLAEVKSPRVIFADADITGINDHHIKALAEPLFGMAVGLRDLGRFNFATVISTLPPIAGERSLPTRFARSLRLDGWGAEMQINAAVAQNHMQVTHFIMKGVKGAFRAGPTRLFDVAPYLRTELVNYSSLVTWKRPVS
jgi:glycosyltransferase involved in cell wall biosynthesis